MTTSFKYISLSHKKAPVEIRELISLDNDSCIQLLQHVKDFTRASEAIVLSTCNRTEVFYLSDKDLSDDIIKLIGLQKGISQILTYKKYFDSSSDNTSSIRHLFDVSMGLEAKVVGDIQISSQVKNAYQNSADYEMAGPFLHRLLHSIFFTNKRVSQETAFRDGAASVSYATAELVEELCSNLNNPRVLILGLGEMGADVCKNLIGSSLSNIFLMNRTFSKAQELAKDTGFTAVEMEQLWDYVDSCDVIVSGVLNDKPIITESRVASLNITSGKFFIDMSMPRSIEPAVDAIPGVLAYNIDTIQAKTTETLQKRLDAIPQVESIIEEAIAEFLDWSKEMEVSPTIKKLKNTLEQIRQEEIGKHLKKFDLEETKVIEKITKGMMQKIIKLPVLQLKAACKRGEAETLIDVLNDLFDLEGQANKVEK